MRLHPTLLLKYIKVKSLTLLEKIIFVLLCELDPIKLTHKTTSLPGPSLHHGVVARIRLKIWIPSTQNLILVKKQNDPALLIQAVCIYAIMFM